MPRISGLLAFIAALLFWPAPVLSAETYPFCPPGESPQFVHGFKAQPAPNSTGSAC